MVFYRHDVNFSKSPDQFIFFPPSVTEESQHTTQLQG